MSPSVRSIGFALCAAVVIGSGSVCMASPVSGSLFTSPPSGKLLETNSTHNAAPLVALKEARDSPIHSISSYSRPRLLRSRAIPGKHALRQISPSELADLNRSYQRAKERSGALRKFSAQAATADPSDGDFQKRFATAAQSYKANILDLKTVLEKLAADKGLAFYNSDDPLEVLLKNVVNLHKDTLSELVETVQSFPFLGPILGPILYELKCIIDDILNITENLVDATLNLLQPILAPLVGSLV